MDLLTQDEEEAERYTRHLRFDIGMLAERLQTSIRHLRQSLLLPVGLFGASTGAAAALIAAAEDPSEVKAVVSRGGRVDLAGDALPLVQAPTLLIVGDLDTIVVELNERAQQRMVAPVEIKLVSGASHLFEEPGALEKVSEFATEWFTEYLAKPKDGN